MERLLMLGSIDLGPGQDAVKRYAPLPPMANFVGRLRQAAGATCILRRSLRGPRLADCGVMR
jgi:hypothetical protein